MDDLSLRPFDRLDSSRLVNWIDGPEARVQWPGACFGLTVDKGQIDFTLAATRCCEEAGPTREGRPRASRGPGDKSWTLELTAILEGEWRAGQAMASAATGDDRR